MAVATPLLKRKRTSTTSCSPAAGQQKIQVVKAVKDLLGVGLKDAKDLVDAAPKAIMEKATKADADAAKAKLEEVGATVELK